MPCREFLAQLRRAYPQIQAMGADALVVGTGAPYQAQELERSGLPFPALLDPEAALYRRLGIRRMRWWELARPSGLRRYARSFLHGSRPGRITGDFLRLPGVVIVDAACAALWTHRGSELGDYPPVDEVLRRLASLPSA